MKQCESCKNNLRYTGVVRSVDHKGRFKCSNGHSEWVNSKDRSIADQLVSHNQTDYELVYARALPDPAPRQRGRVVRGFLLGASAGTMFGSVFIFAAAFHYPGSLTGALFLTLGAVSALVGAYVWASVRRWPLPDNEDVHDTQDT